MNLPLLSWCARCKSPDELGSHMSTLKCQKCPTKEGLLMPQCDMFNETESDYYCDFCDNQVTGNKCVNHVDPKVNPVRAGLFQHA